MNTLSKMITELSTKIKTEKKENKKKANQGEILQKHHEDFFTIIPYFTVLMFGNYLREHPQVAALPLPH